MNRWRRVSLPWVSVLLQAPQTVQELSTSLRVFIAITFFLSMLFGVIYNWIGILLRILLKVTLLPYIITIILPQKISVVLLGDTTENPFWDFVRDFLKKPSPEQLACQHPKPILLDTGEVIITTIPVCFKCTSSDCCIIQSCTVYMIHFLIHALLE